MLEFEDDEEPLVNKVQTLKERIKQLRTQMLIHSYLYYWLDNPIWSDGEWQHAADELVELQKSCNVIGFYDEEFLTWDGSTGSHLPKEKWIKDKAHWLLEQHNV